MERTRHAPGGCAASPDRAGAAPLPAVTPPPRASVSGVSGVPAEGTAAAMPAFTPQGLAIDLHVARGQVIDLTVRSTRQAPLRSWIAGTTPGEALRRIGLAFSLCRSAQRAACEAALETASAATVRTESAAERAWHVTGELWREHACNLFLAWPELLGDAQQPALVRPLLAAAGEPAVMQGKLRDLLANGALGMDPPAWLQLDAAGLQAWCTRAATATARRFARWYGATAPAPVTPRLPPVARWGRPEAKVIAATLRADPDFALHPAWAGSPAETGAIARVHAHPLLRAWIDHSGNDAGARMLARLIELAQAADAGPPAAEAIVRAWPVGSGSALAAVETSRGVLLHAVDVARDRITDYRIVAPTGWNFHPHGVLRAALGSRRDAPGCGAQAQAWSLALDPCVECTVERVHA